MKPVIMGMMVAMTAGAVAASPLDKYVGHARVLVVSGPSPDDPDLLRQSAILSAASADLQARDLVVVDAVSAGAEARTAVGLPASAFGVALVGKDGGVKLRRRMPISTRTLFSVIDAMPMRQAEMRRLEHPR